ncbi:LysR family transcriptional regulator [Actinocorallia lasiicapitis]
MIELRDIEIFLTLAEELHFGRTAERLHISQSRVSQAIKKQERQIGAVLFDRTSRSVALTPVGQRLRQDLQQASELIASGLARAGEAGQGERGELRIGAMGMLGSELRSLIEKFQADHPACAVEIVEFQFSEPFEALRSGAADALLLWLPVREPDLVVGPVALTEGRILAVPSTWDLARRESVSMEDLGGLTMVDPGSSAPDYWMGAMLPRYTATGRLIPRGPAVRTIHDVLNIVASGQAASTLNEHSSWYYNHPCLTALPIHDAPTTEWAFVWSATNQNRHLPAFMGTVRTLGPRPLAPAARRSKNQPVIRPGLRPLRNRRHRPGIDDLGRVAPTSHAAVSDQLSV